MVWIKVEEELSNFRQKGCKSMINTMASQFSISIDYCSQNNNVINSRKIVFITKTLIILYSNRPSFHFYFYSKTIFKNHYSIKIYTNFYLSFILYNHKQLKVKYHLMKGKTKDKSKPLSKGNKSQRGRGEVDMKQTQAFLNRPVKKLDDLNTNLKKSYDKTFFNQPRFSHFNILKQKSKRIQSDSVTSEQNQKQDSDYEVSKPRNKAVPKKESSEKSSSSSSSVEKQKQKKSVKQNTSTKNMKKEVKKDEKKVQKISKNVEKRKQEVKAVVAQKKSPKQEEKQQSQESSSYSQTIVQFQSKQKTPQTKTQAAKQNNKKIEEKKQSKEESSIESQSEQEQEEEQEEGEEEEEEEEEEEQSEGQNSVSEQVESQSLSSEKKQPVLKKENKQHPKQKQILPEKNISEHSRSNRLMEKKKVYNKSKPETHQHKKENINQQCFPQRRNKKMQIDSNASASSQQKLCHPRVKKNVQVSKSRKADGKPVQKFQQLHFKDQKTNGGEKESNKANFKQKLKKASQKLFSNKPSSDKPEESLKKQLQPKEFSPTCSKLLPKSKRVETENNQNNKESSPEQQLMQQKPQKKAWKQQQKQKHKKLKFNSKVVLEQIHLQPQPSATPSFITPQTLQLIHYLKQNFRHAPCCPHYKSQKDMFVLQRKKYQQPEEDDQISDIESERSCVVVSQND